MSEAPPPYSRVDPVAASGSEPPGPSHSRTTRNGIPPEHRRSMEDQNRDLPQGWLRQFDPKRNHHFYVDTKADPPRSIWHHPYDDQQFLETLPMEERERVQELTRHSSFHDIVAESSEDEGQTSNKASKLGQGELPPRPGKDDKKADKGGWGRRMKDKITNTTHEQREKERQQRAEQERKAYEQHLHTRQVMQKAMETGQPQLLGKDKDGRDVYIEPPAGYGGGYGGYGGNRPYGVNPFGQQQYASPNARYIQPASPYRRPYGMGYGGGYGLPLAAGLGGGLAGGLLLGDMMGGGFGMGGMGMGMGGMGGMGM